MNNKKFIGITTTMLSISLMVLFVQTSQNLPEEVFAESSERLLEQVQTQENVSLEFSAPETIVAGKLVPINARVIDADRFANLSHTDWAYSVIGSDGEIVHKSTTLHGHFGIMNFKNSFPEEGEYTIKYTVSSSGPFMLGMPVPELGQTRAVVSGDLLKFEKDPKNNFGSRTFEFKVDVKSQGTSLILEGSEEDAAILVNFSTQPQRIVTGQPATFVLDIDDAQTGEDATHVDGLFSIRRGNYYPSTSGDQPNAPIALNGAYHGHQGVLSVTQTFNQPGTYVIMADLSTIPYSKPLFGETSTRFVIQVFDSKGTEDIPQIEQIKNTVNIVGLESPFYQPNVIRTSIGEIITFDNVDGNQHTVTSVKAGTIQPDGMFDSSLMKPGEKFELTLDQKGTYDYYCALHTNMKGTIIVS